MTSIPVPLQRLWNVLESLVDDQVGIVRHVREFSREAGAPDFFHFYAEACNTSALCPQENFGKTGGASTERGLAMAKAVGEAVERYCAAMYNPNDLPLCTYDDAPFTRIPPEEFALYQPVQYSCEGFPYSPFIRDSLVRWTPARDLATNEMCHVPAAMVFVPYYYDKAAGELPIVQPISTGLACHCSFEEAAASAICEVIERDAFTIVWQAQLAPPRISIESLSEEAAALVRRFERANLDVTLFDITLDHGIPTLLSVAQARCADAPALAFAAAAHLDPHEALRKSLEELAHTSRLARILRIGPRFFPGSSYENVRTLHDHLRMYVDHTNKSLTDFLFSSARSVDFEDIPNHATSELYDDLEVLIQRIRGVGHRVLCTDLTTPDVGQLGLCVVRCIIPGFHPLFIGHHLRACGGTRLWQVPQLLGYQGIMKESGDNSAPHPYP
jgi:ribosomal protein S12 methylthiotransferase accessory factor